MKTNVSLLTCVPLNEVVPIVLGATGLITSSLVKYMTKLFNKDVSLEIIRKLQQKALIGSMRVVN